MRLVEVANVSRGRLLAARAEAADTFLGRALGLMGRTGWSNTDGLILEPCGAVHSFFMRMPIDVLFIGADGQVLHALAGLPPWRLGWPVRGARWVLELPAGTLTRTGTAAGDEVVRRPATARGEEHRA